MTTKTTIPKGWKEIKLGQLFDFRNGVNADKASYGEGVRFINVMEVIKHNILMKDAIPGKVMLDEKRVEKNLVIYGDVLFNRTSETPEEIGLTSVYLDTEKVVFGGFVIRARSKNKQIEDGFKKYCFSSPILRKEIMRNGQGVVRMNIGQEDLSKISIILPPLSEQEKIVKVLEAWDDYLEKLTRTIKTKKKIKKGLMQKLLSGKSRLPEFDTQWIKSNAGEIFKNISRKNFPDEELLSATQKNGILPRTMLKGRVTMPAGSRAAYKLVEPGNFVISLRSFQGGLEYSHYRGIVSPAYTILTEKKKINNDFYRHYFKSHDFIGHLDIAVIGIRDGKQISFSDFCVVKIPDISLPEQTAIARILTTADQEIEAIEKKKTIIEKQKKFLLNNLITGKIRLPEFINAT